ncbi:hypothetical protein [Neisseria flavescens]|uniref:hypothetical protein n=1 Tax=Neisseria flavescens TaxID=484 RepID=UPI0024B0C9A5|nr:hypothetical protein [Neisseria flavescens]
MPKCRLKTSVTSFAKIKLSPKIVLYAQSGMNDFVFNIPFSVFQTTYRDNPFFDLKICSDDSKDVITALGASIPIHGGLDLTKEADIIVIAGWRNQAKCACCRLKGGPDA